MKFLHLPISLVLVNLGTAMAAPPSQPLVLPSAAAASAPQPAAMPTKGAVSTATTTQAAAQVAALRVAANPPVVKAAGTPTIGDWEDLTQREAYKKRQEELSSSATASAHPQAMPPGGPLPPLANAVQPQQTTAPDSKDKPKRRMSEACDDDGQPCFFAVYGVSVEGVGNNYRGMVAMNGRVYTVSKGTRFSNYEVNDITTRELRATNLRTKKKVAWPYAGELDIAADPIESAKKPDANQQRPMSVLGGPSLF